MAADYVRLLRARGAAGPYRLVGYSFGGLVAYEMARLLGTDAASVALLRMLAEDIGLTPPVPDSTAACSPQPPRPGWCRRISRRRRPSGSARLYQQRQPGRSLSPTPGLATKLLQLRALQRDTELPDWLPLASGQVATRDLDCTHRGLIGAAIAGRVAEAILQETTHG